MFYSICIENGLLHTVTKMCMDELSITCISKIYFDFQLHATLRLMTSHFIERNLRLGTLMYPEQANTAALAL